MKTGTIKIIFAWVLVVLWMAVIFSFSSQKDTQSIALSGKATEKIALIVKFVTFGNYNLDTPEKISMADEIVRKAAHLIEFFILGLLVVTAFIKSRLKGDLLIVFSAAFCVLYALFDELHQLFVQGRAMQFEDFLIDSAGALMGIIIVKFTVYLIKKKA